MQFSCDSCKTQLQIADEKVRGKRLIVRCRRCGAKITIADPALAGKLTRPVQQAGARRAAASQPGAAAQPAPAAAQRAKAVEDPKRDSDTESTRAMDSAVLERALEASKSEHPEDVLGAKRPAAPATATPVDAPIWFAMLHGKQVGPLTRIDLAGRAAAGEVGPRTYLWREGMDSWQRAREVPELADLFPPPAEPSHAPSLLAPEPASPPTELAAARNELEETPPAGLAPLGERVLSEPGEPDAAAEPSPVVTSADLASWANSDLGRQSSPGVAKARPAPVAAPAPVEPAARPRPASTPRMFESAAPPRSRAPAAVVLVVVLAAAALGAWLFLGSERKAPETPQPAAEAAADASAEPEAAAPRDASAPRDAATPRDASTSPDAAPAKPSTGKPSDRKR